MKARMFLHAMALLLAIAPLAAMAEDGPAYLRKHEATIEDHQAIAKLLDTYTASVTKGDEAAFEALLIDDQVPFSSTGEITGHGADGQAVTTRNYQRFRKSVFESGVRYTQHFYNIRIDQDGPLAQVSLDFITQETKSGKGGYGWKTLQLLKVQGHWKIASEFYTARALPGQS